MINIDKFTSNAVFIICKLIIINYYLYATIITIHSNYSYNYYSDTSLFYIQISINIVLRQSYG